MVEIMRGRGSRRLAIGTTVLLLGGGLAACSGVGPTVTRLAVGQPGPDAFTLVANTDQPNLKPKQAAGGQQSGGAPGLYGGTHKTSTCDRDKLVAFLRDNPDKARAWASVHQISTAAIPAYISRLTPVILRTDTLVTNYGYRAGTATSFQAVLQAGVGVLVDGHGTPVVKCNCGNPLTSPHVDSGNAHFTGTSWSDFGRARVTVIVPVTIVVNVFVLVEPDGDTSFRRPRHSEGDEDGPLRPPPPDVKPVSPLITPSSQSPGSGSPGTGSPGTGSPGTGSPGTGTPGTGSPGTGTPGTETPGTGSPGFGPSGGASPGTETPNTGPSTGPTAGPSGGDTSGTVPPGPQVPGGPGSAGPGPSTDLSGAPQAPQAPPGGPTSDNGGGSTGGPGIGGPGSGGPGTGGSGTGGTGGSGSGGSGSSGGSGTTTGGSGTGDNGNSGGSGGGSTGGSGGGSGNSGTNGGTGSGSGSGSGGSGGGSGSGSGGGQPAPGGAPGSP